MDTVTASTGLPDPWLRPTLTVPEAGAFYGFGRSKSYVEARRYIRTGGLDGIPAILCGRTLRCPTALVLKHLGLWDDAAQARAS